MDMEILRWCYPFSLAGTVNIFLRHAEFRGDKYVDEGLIFCQVDGRRIHPRNFTRHFDKVIEDAGIAHIAFHAIWHTHASELKASGVDLKTIQERPGHSSYQITADLYTHIGEELQRDAADKANEVLNRRKKCRRPGLRLANQPTRLHKKESRINAR